MLLVSLIIIYVACGLLDVTTIFIKKKGALYFYISALTLIFFVIAGILSANYNNYFGGFSIISIISIFPLFLALFEKKPKEIIEEEKIINFDSQIQEIKEQFAMDIVLLYMLGIKQPSLKVKGEYLKALLSSYRLFFLLLADFILAKKRLSVCYSQFLLA